jgi:hypothetical protein
MRAQRRQAAMRDHDIKLRWPFQLGLDLGSPIGEAGRLSVEVAAVMLLKHTLADQFAHVERDRAVVFDGALAF